MSTNMELFINTRTTKTDLLVTILGFDLICVYSLLNRLTFCCRPYIYNPNKSLIRKIWSFLMINHFLDLASGGVSFEN